MKKNLLFLLCCLLAVNFFGQERAQRTKKYMKIDDYKKRYHVNDVILTKGNHIIVKKDTLILILDEKINKGVSVKYEEKDSTFLEIYKDIVYKKYSDSNIIKDNQKEYMRLWKNTIKIFFDESFDEYYQSTILKAATKLSNEIDSLNITFVKDIKESNYIFYEIKDENSIKYSSDIANNRFIDYYIKWDKGKIYDVKLELDLRIYPNITKEITANYLLQNFYQTLGRFFKSDKIPCNSMFSSCNSNRKELTDIDLEILKYHYSYGICKFTDLKDFEENHKKAIETIKNGGVMYFIHVD